MISFYLIKGTFQRGGRGFNLSREHSPTTRARIPEAEGKSITDSEERIRGIDHPQTWESRQSHRIQHHINSACAERERYFQIGSDQKRRRDFEADEFHLGFLGTTDILGPEKSPVGGEGGVGGPVLYTVRCLAAPWPLPARCQQQALVGKTENVPRHCPLSPGMPNWPLRTTHRLKMLLTPL